MNGKTGIIIQARWGSKRFPGKAMAKISGRPIINWMIEIAQRTGLPYAFAIPECDKDTPLGKALSGCYLGSEDDVLERFYGAAIANQFNLIVRLTADCPLVDSRLIGRMIHDMPHDCPYYGITNAPDGNDVEVFTIDALREARKFAAPHEREHVTTYMKSMKGALVINGIPEFHGIKYSIDTPDDLERVQQMVWKVGEVSGMDAYVTYLRNGNIDVTHHPVERQRLNITKSNALYERASKVIPMCCQTSSKSAKRFANGFGPKYIDRAKGAYVWDVDGNKFIDWHMGLGPVTIGHADDRVNNAATHAANFGNCVTLPTAWEVDLAEKVTQWTHTDKVRFLKTGSDADSAAVRLARAFTGRDKILRCGYHGWHDWALNADYAEKRGIPLCVRDQTVSLKYGEKPTHLDLYAGFIVEAINLEPINREWLEETMIACRKAGVVVIFDEVITGLRVAKGGAAEYLKLKPDLITMGKGLANGWPISAVCGRADIMDCFEHTHISGTWYGETTAMAAALMTMEILESENFWKHSDKVGNYLKTWYRQYISDLGAKDYTEIKGSPYFTTIIWKDPAHFTLFQQEMMREGILFDGCQFPCLAHGDNEMRATVRAYRIAIEKTMNAIKDGKVMEELQCEVNQTLFKRN